jgi:hypothetical protein
MPSIYYKNYQPNPTGQLTCGGSTVNSITLNFSYTNATTDIRIYHNQALVYIIDISAGRSGNGNYTVNGLAAGTPYTYKLIHGNNVNEQLLAQTQCRTQDPPPPPPNNPPPPPPPAARMTYPISTFSANRTVVIETVGTTYFVFAAGAANVTINGRPGTEMSGPQPEGSYTIVKVDPNIHVCLSVTATLVTRIS